MPEKAKTKRSMTAVRIWKTVGTAALGYGWVEGDENATVSDLMRSLERAALEEVASK